MTRARYDAFLTRIENLGSREQYETLAEEIARLARDGDPDAPDLAEVAALTADLRGWLPPPTAR